MTKRWNISESLQSIAGGTFLGLGLHILSVNLRGDAIQLRRLFDIPATDALGLLPSIALATSQAKGNALSHAMFLHTLLHMLASLWPLLPVFLGTVLLRSALTDKVKALPVSDEYFRNKYFQNKRSRMSISVSLVRRLNRAKSMGRCYPEPRLLNRNYSEL